MSPDLAGTAILRLLTVARDWSSSGHAQGPSVLLTVFDRTPIFPGISSAFSKCYKVGSNTCKIRYINKINIVRYALDACCSDVAVSILLFVKKECTSQLPPFTQ